MKKLFKVGLFFIILVLCVSSVSACSKHKHKYSNAWSSDDTYHWHNATCKHKSEVSDKQTHQWDAGVLVSGDECGEGSKVLFTCTVCGRTQEKTNVDHNYVASEVVEPTCSKIGYTSYECSRCDSSCIATFTDALGHEFGESVPVKSVTCISSGIYEQSCSRCEEVNKYTLNATGHSYFAISSNNEEIVYECENCFETITVLSGETVNTTVETEELFDVDVSFSFDIITDENEQYIRNNLKIIDGYFVDTEYENNQAMCQYTIAKKGKGVWTISPSKQYEFDSTYTVKLSGDIEFAEYNCKELNFTTIEDENHENNYEYVSGIVFLKALELTNPGYYPYDILSTENADYLYLTVGKIDDLHIGQIICVGDVINFEDIDSDTECYFGKIDSYYMISDNQWMVVLSEPEIDEIFAELDISFDELVDFDSEDIDVDKVEEELIGALYRDEDFAEFLGVISVSATKYFADNNYDTSEVSNVKSFMDYVKIDPDVNFEGTKMTSKIEGTIKVPIKDSNKNEIGNFEVSFTVNMESQFEVDVSYKLKKKWGIPYGLKYFDVGLTQTDAFGFEFNVSIDIDYSLEEHKYVQNIESGKIHRLGCAHVTRMTDMSKLKGISATKAEKEISQKPELECKHCRPVQGFKEDLLVINTSAQMIIHNYGCVHIGQMTSSNIQISEEKATYWIKQGYSCCEWCHPDNREEKEYDAYIASTIYCSDWQQVATDITQMAKDSGASEHNKKGITIVDVDIPIYGAIKFTIEIDFVFSFELEASFNYKYSYTQSNTYGMRITSSGCKSYNASSFKVVSNELTLMGKANVKVGLLVDANVNISGLSKWIRAGVTAEVGLYADLHGVLHLSFTDDEDYAAAYFEAGIYLKIEGYYKLFKWKGDDTYVDKKWPLLNYGYDYAYFAYETYYDELTINESYDIAENDLLVVEYFDLKKMTTSTEELSLTETDKYKVVITFEDGKYCKIENGVIVVTDDAPESFTDKMIIVVECDQSWKDYVKGNSVFYLGTYEIELHFGDSNSHSHTPGETVIEDFVSPTCTENGKYDEVICCAACGDEISRKVVEVETTGAHVLAGLPVDSEEFVSKYMPEGSDVIYSSTPGIIIPSDSVCGCVVPGSYICEVCGEMVNCDVHKLHTPGKIINPASCVMPGVYECIDCGQPISSHALGHNYLDGKCSVCGETDPDHVPVIQYSKGLEFTSNGDNTCYVSGIGTCTDTNIIIPPTSPAGDSVVSIGDSAFYSCRNLINIEFPNTVTSIGYNALYNCDSLESIVIPNSVTNIDGRAFYHCDKLTNVEIGSGISSLGSYVFSNCSFLNKIDVSKDNLYYKSIDGNLYTKDGTTLIQYAIGKADKEFIIPDGVISITSYAFSSCSHVKTITIPDSVTNLSGYSFYACGGLNYISVSKDNSYYKSIEGNLYSKDGATLVKYASAKNDNIFVLPNEVINIDSWAFALCHNLERITLPNIKTIGFSAFYGCSMLETVTMGNQITSIGQESFRDCRRLLDITISESVTNIGFDPFSGCDNLVIWCEMASQPSEWKSEWNHSNHPVIWDCRKNGIADNGTTYVVVDGIRYILENNEATVIRQYWSIVSANIPSTVMYNDLSYSVTNIDKAAFYDCYKLVSVTIPSSVIRIGYSAFFCNDSPIYCEAESKPLGWDSRWTGSSNPIVWDCNNNNIANDGYIYTFSNGILYALKDGEAIVCEQPRNYITKASIPTNIIYNNFSYRVTIINGYAFQHCTLLMSVVIPESITRIDTWTFYACDSLTNIVIPDSVTSIGDEAFAECDSLETVIIGNGCVNIASSAFYACDTLTEIKVSEDNAHYKSIDGNLYTSDETILVNYAIGKNNLHFEISSSVTTIENYAFWGCTSITSITIPNSVILIGNGAFIYCTSLTDVYYTGSEAEWSAISIESGNSNLTSANLTYNYVPEE